MKEINLSLPSLSVRDHSLLTYYVICVSLYLDCTQTKFDGGLHQLPYTVIIIIIIIIIIIMFNMA